MHLIFSNIITEKRLWNNLDVTQGDERNRPSMAASTLRSLEGLSINSADIYLEFDETTEWSKEALLKIVEDLPFECKVFPFRLDSFKRWSQASQSLNAISEDQILLCCSEDHVRFSSDSSEFEYLAELLSNLQGKHPSLVLILPLSHFPETHAMIPISQRTGTGLRIEGIPLIPWQIPGGPIVVGIEQFQAFWSEDFTKGKPFVGLENALGPSLRLPNAYYLCPRKELFRHLDSYGHIGVNKWPYSVLNPNINIYKKNPQAESSKEYKLSSDPRRPQGEVSMTVAAEKPGDSAKDALRMSILKSSFIRPSWSSISWVATAYDVDKISAARGFCSAIVRHPEFAARSLMAIVSVPLHLALGFLGLFIRQSSKLRVHYIWFITYGSSIGYLKLLLLSVRAKIPKFSAGDEKLSNRPTGGHTS